jgi:methylmalonyl-CoA mutase N-terminal domain/subunit
MLLQCGLLVQAVHSGDIDNSGSNFYFVEVADPVTSESAANTHDRVFSPADLAALDFNYERDLGDPGVAPFTRGIERDLYGDQPWIMGQYSGFTSAKATNLRFKQLLENGQTGFSIALDLPTQMGLSSDDVLAAGEVGKVGVPLNSLADMETLLEGIDLAAIRQIRTTANAIGPIFAAMIVVMAEKQGIDPNSIRIMIQNDPLKEYIARGAYIFAARNALRFAADLVEYAIEHLPRWEPIEYCGYHIRDSGCEAHHEVGITLANACAYLGELARRGVDLELACSQSVLFLSADVRIFQEAAKFRAARRMFSRLVRERYGVSAAGSSVTIFCYTLGGSLTAQEPMNNVVRTSYQALAAALGGVQTLATSSYDEALGLPSDAAVHLALRTQQILAYETDAIEAVDPLGGSYYVEKLTTDVEARAAEVFASIEARGGSVEAIESGFLHDLIADASYQAILAAESGASIRVAVNKFVRADGDETHIQPAVQRDGTADALASLEHIRSGRDEAAVATALRGLDDAAAGTANTMPALLDAIRAYATMGEICDVLRARWGHYQERL